MGSTKTIISWIYLNANQDNQAAIYCLSGGDGYGAIEFFDSPTNNIQFVVSQGKSNKFAMSTSTWYHVAAVYPATNLPTIYIDGVDKGNLAETTSIGTPSTALVIGAYDEAVADRYFKGIIGEVLVIDKALTAAEILYHYNNTKGRYL